MMTSSNGNIFRVTGPLCGEFTGPGEFPTQRPVTRSFDVFFDLPLNKRLSKQPWGWWFETPSWSLWRQCKVLRYFLMFGHLPDLNNSKHRAILKPIHHCLFSRVYHIKYILLFVSSVIFELDSDEIPCQIVTMLPCVLYVSCNKMAINYHSLGNLLLLLFFNLLVHYEDRVNNIMLIFMRRT